MKGKVFVRHLKGININPQLYVITEEGNVQFWSEESRGWLVSGLTEEDFKKRIKSGEFEEVKF